MNRTRTCTNCGWDAHLTFNADPVCRDCFADAVASMLLDQAEREGLIDDTTADLAYDTFMARGYEDADTLLNGGRLSY